MNRLFTIWFLLTGSICLAQTHSGNSIARFDLKAFLQDQKPPVDTAVLNTTLLSGSWTGEALGNNWVMGKPLIKPDRKIVFTETQVFFFYNGKLERVTAYRLLENPLKIRQQTFLIEFEDNKQTWGIKLLPVGQNVPWNGIAQKPYLLLNAIPNCICGCPESVYSKNDFLAGK